MSNQHGAALAAEYHALSADHLEHLDEAGAKAMAAAGTVAVLLPGAFYALQEKRKPPVELLRKHKVPMAVATDCNPGTSPLLSPTLAMNMACTLFGLTPEEAVAGMTINAARALGLAHSDRQHRRRQAGGPLRVAHRIACRARLLDRPAGAGAADLWRDAMRRAARLWWRSSAGSGLALQFAATYGVQHDVPRPCGCSLRFFTILTNLLVAIAMTLIAIGRPVSPLVLGGLTLGDPARRHRLRDPARGLKQLDGPARSWPTCFTQVVADS